MSQDSYLLRNHIAKPIPYASYLPTLWGQCVRHRLRSVTKLSPTYLPYSIVL